MILGGAGIFLIVPKLQDWIATAAAPLVGWAGERQQRFDERGLWAQGAIGALLGLVWSPCVGPTLGAAVALGAQGRDLSQVALTMAAFALGIAAVLVAIAAAGRTLFSRVRGRIASKAKVAKLGLGIILVLVSLLVLSGLDRVIEAAFVLAAPDWLINLSTAI